MTTTWTIKHWQFVVFEMLTVDGGTKMDIAKTFHVNSTIGPDATFHPSLMWKYSIFTLYNIFTGTDMKDIPTRYTYDVHTLFRLSIRP